MKGLIPFGARKAILVHAVGSPHLEVMKHGMAHFLEPYLARQQAILADDGFETDVVLTPGPAVTEVNRIAQRSGASLIVVGTHGATSAREMLIGGTAMGIVHQATLPVLVIRLKTLEEEGGTQCVAACDDFRDWGDPSVPRDCRALRVAACDNFRAHVLYCTDFSETAERAFLYVQRIVESGAKLATLLHVQDKTRIGKYFEHRLEEFNRIDRTRLERLKARLEEIAAVQVRVHLAYGHPVEEILKVAHEDEDTLIVMGSQGRGFLEQVFLGSVSHQVVRQASVPVLLVPAQREGEPHHTWATVTSQG